VLEENLLSADEILIKPLRRRSYEGAPASGSNSSLIWFHPLVGLPRSTPCETVVKAARRKRRQQVLGGGVASFWLGTECCRFGRDEVRGLLDTTGSTTGLPPEPSPYDFAN
jgi:hypothetical protein